MDEKELASALLAQSEKTLCAAFPSLLRGLRRLTLQPREGEPFGTDGRRFFYDPAAVCRLWRESPGEGNRALLHSLLHCLLLHPYETGFRDRALWNKACDVCVESLIDSWRLTGTADRRDDWRRTLLAPVKKQIKHLTAENLYAAFRDGNFADLPAEAFFCDSHTDWLFSGRSFFSRPQSDEVTESTESIYQMASNRTGGVERTGLRTDNDVVNSAAEEDEKAWKQITSQTLSEAGLSSRYGVNGGLDTVVLGAAVRERGNYERFLRKFLALAETPELSDEEFDYIFYTYGLQLYGNMPIIEPLESTENARLRRLFIAIDTSGSVRGETVRRFVEKTCGILRTSGFYTGATAVTIYQCDTEIRDVAVVHSPAELEHYAANVTLHGFGGTDYRPVFDAVDEALRDVKIGEMNGLLYFTDGDGVYPKQAPAYRTVFLLSDAAFDPAKLPAWAVGVPMDSGDLTEGGL